MTLDDKLLVELARQARATRSARSTSGTGQSSGRRRSRSRGGEHWRTTQRPRRCTARSARTPSATVATGRIENRNALLFSARLTKERGTLLVAKACVEDRA
jgi:hypothetical protein